MSNIARWSYKNVATVRPFVGRDKFNSPSYGPEYEIACNWSAKVERRTDPTGKEFVSQHDIFTEDPRPKYQDQISFEHSSGWQTIKAVTSWDMAMFKTTPDFKLTT